MNEQALQVQDFSIQLGESWISLSEAKSTPELLAIWELSAKIESVRKGFDEALKSAEASWAEQLRSELAVASRLVAGLGERLVTARAAFERETLILQSRASSLEAQTDSLGRMMAELTNRVALLEQPWWKQLWRWIRSRL